MPVLSAAEQLISCLVQDTFEQRRIGLLSTVVAKMTSSQHNTRSKTYDALSQLTDRELLIHMSHDIAQVKSDVSSLKSDVAEVKADVTEVKTSLQFSQADIEDLKTKVSALEDDLASKTETIERLNIKVQTLEQRQTDTENYSKKYNLIFDNIPEQKNENIEEAVRAVFRDNLGLDDKHILIDNTHRLKATKKKGPRSTIVRFVKYLDKQKVWNERSKLRDSGIYMREHLPPEMTNRQRSLMPVYKALKSKEIEVSLKNDTIIYAGQKYDVANIANLYELLQDTDPCATIGDVYAYFGRHSPLSNFYRCDFTFEDRSYTCVEEAYQSKKAEYYNRPDIATQVTTARDPALMKRQGDRLENDDWYTSGEAERIMTNIVRAKFVQCDRPARFLKNTNEVPIAEASPHDQFWGIGLSRMNKDCLSRDKWDGQNRMGRILEAIRQELADN